MDVKSKGWLDAYLVREVRRYRDDNSRLVVLTNEVHDLMLTKVYTHLPPWVGTPTFWEYETALIAACAAVNSERYTCPSCDVSYPRSELANAQAWIEAGTCPHCRRKGALYTATMEEGSDVPKRTHKLPYRKPEGGASNDKEWFYLDPKYQKNRRD